ncbi:MAG: hypothetical protein JO040_00965 [Gemmatimonadetes bacterium]|nr:hypothetical protein [Gemmatimonadota bacterium]
MSHSLSDYFALEAGEFLEQLDALLTQGGTPDAERLFRLSRGVRGSARVAQEAEIAGVAEALESAARGLHERSLPWSEELRALAIRTVDDLRALVRARGQWGAAESARAREAVSRWEPFHLERGPVQRTETPGDQLLDFLRREVVGVVSELDHLGEELRRTPEEREPLRSVVRRMRPLRGMAGVASLAPIQEVLEGVEDAVQAILAQPTPLTDAHLELFAAASGALRGGLAALERGEAAPDAELAPFRESRDRLSDAGDREAESEDDVLPISAFFYDDAGPHVLSSPLAPVQTASGGGAREEVERFLRLEATGFLDRAEALISDLAPRREKRFTRVAGQLGRLAQSVGELAGTYGIAAVRDAAERAAGELRDAGSAAEARAALARLRGALPGASAAGAQPAAAPETPAEAPASAEASASPEAPGAPPEPAESADDVIPIESLLLRGDAALGAALDLRPEIERLAADGGAPGLRDLLAEVFDLVALGREAPTTP